MQQKKTVNIFQNLLLTFVLVTGVFFAGAVSASAQGMAVSKGVVGESGASSLLYTEGSGNTTFVLKNIDTSLCPNTGAVAVLVVNGEPVSHGNITARGSFIKAEVSADDKVIAIVHSVPLFNGIACIRLGELEVEMKRAKLD